MLKLTTKQEEGTAPEITETLDELAREGARRMIAEALKLEADAYVAQLRQLRDEKGHAQVVARSCGRGNGKARPRTVTLGVGAVAVEAPRVHDRRPGHKFTSHILPLWARRSPRLEAALPVLYLRGLSTGDFADALPVLLGPEAAGLSASTISRLTAIWQDEHRTWRKRSLAGKDYVYLWVDGVNFGVRLEDDRLTCLVIIGVNGDGTKEVIAIEDGYRESTESWATVLRNLKRRGMPPALAGAAPVLAVARSCGRGDGALGFWAALCAVYPETREQRGWVHKLANVLDKLPKRLQPRAKAMLYEIMHAPSRQDAEDAIARFVGEYQARYPKATECLTADQEALLTFFDFPAEHWIHLRTTNPVESPFATVKARTRTTKGAGSRNAGLAMAFKLALAAQERWRKVNAPHLVALVRAGVTFKDGARVTEAQSAAFADTESTHEAAA